MIGPGGPVPAGAAKLASGLIRAAMYASAALWPRRRYPAAGRRDRSASCNSYGFPPHDKLDDFGPEMRYLQTECGARQHSGGAHWFPDAITVTVPSNQPAG
jgi:hypothetical protein